MNSFSAILDRQGFVMLDGGLATEMERRGADLDDDLWSARMLIDAPEIIRLVHTDFLRAGADVIATATYQASFEGFAAAGHGPDAAESLLRLGVDLAVLARESFWAHQENHAGRQRPLVAASIGPYGASLHDGSEYHGNYDLSLDELKAFHRPRMQVLADTDMDLFAFETIPSLLEAQALIELMDEFPGRSAWLSYSCRNGREVSHGESFAKCAALADSALGLVSVGINCTAPAYVGDLLETAQGCGTPLAVYPNSGETWNAETNDWLGDGCNAFPVEEWFGLGARIFGGCCRTGAGDISRIRDQLKRLVDSRDA